MLSFFISPSPTSHAHTRICFNLSMHPPPLALSVRPWHKCICSIPPANRLVGCYQRQEEGDNGFHHIFSLPQIKMGQVIQHTQTHTPAFTLTNTHTQHSQYPHTGKADGIYPTQQQNDCNLAFFCSCSLFVAIGFPGQSIVTSQCQKTQGEVSSNHISNCFGFGSHRRTTTHTHTCQNHRIH